MLLKDITDPEIYLALKRVCNYIVNEAWHTTADFEYDYAVAKTKQYEDEIDNLSKIDLDIGWGDEKKEVSPGTWVTTHVGDFNPWYDGNITLQELLNAMDPLAENVMSAEPRYTAEMEFLHYYRALTDILPQPEHRRPAIITIHDLHPKIKEHCLDRFEDGHYSDAILAAYKVVLNEIKDITGIYDQDGKPLVERALAPGNPIIKLNPLVTQSDKDEQQGFMFLFSGAAVGIRNPKAHDLVVQSDQQKALSYLVFASLLIQRLDERHEP